MDVNLSIKTKWPFSIFFKSKKRHYEFFKKATNKASVESHVDNQRHGTKEVVEGSTNGPKKKKEREE